MKRSMCITYEVGEALYVNVTNKCSNRCDFCIRNNGEGAYGSDSLWLEREPTAREIEDAILQRDLAKYSELVFCGYGEPSYRLPEISAIARSLKEKGLKLPIRINTNGQSDLILGFNSAPLYKGAFDVVSISLNSASAEDYERICHPVYGKEAFFAILSFAKRVKAAVPSAVFSVVDEFISEEEIEKCRLISAECGIPLRVREYIGPEA